MGSETQISMLNRLLKHQLTVINQYFLHARMLKKYGMAELADHSYKASLEAMRGADMLIEYMLSCDVLPAMASLGTLNIGGSSRQIVANDLELTRQTAGLIVELLPCCNDRTSQEMLNSLMLTTQDRIALMQHYLDSDAGVSAPLAARRPEYAAVEEAN